MVYRRLGRTGLLISEISLGGSPLPDERLFFRLIERGINYIDASESYENGNVERLIGRAFKTSEGTSFTSIQGSISENPSPRPASSPQPKRACAVSTRTTLRSWASTASRIRPT